MRHIRKERPGTRDFCRDPGLGTFVETGEASHRWDPAPETWGHAGGTRDPGPETLIMFVRPETMNNHIF